MKFLLTVLTVFYCFLSLVESSVHKTKERKVAFVDKHWVCRVKKTCADCLSLSHCVWCNSTGAPQCFSPKLTKNFCVNDRVTYIDHGLSFHNNANCVCTNGALEEDCLRPGAEGGPLCSGRGTCECGRCVCHNVAENDSLKDALQNPAGLSRSIPSQNSTHPWKIVGRYCEYDNFSCDGPACNEGPYLLPMELIEKDPESSNTVE